MERWIFTEATWHALASRRKGQNIRSRPLIILSLLHIFIGKTVTIDELIENEGFDAVFIGSGAGLPKFMGIPGETACGVLSANEFLTRNNLMKAFDESYDTCLLYTSILPSDAFFDEERLDYGPKR